MTLSPRLAREGEASKYLLNSSLLYFGSPRCAVHREEPVSPLCPSLNTVAGRTGQNTEIEMPGLCLSETCLWEGSWGQSSGFDGGLPPGRHLAHLHSDHPTPHRVNCRDPWGVGTTSIRGWGSSY